LKDEIKKAAEAAMIGCVELSTGYVFIAELGA
jgi:hypothetical protein